MGITTVPSAITGQTLSAADWNTQVRDNINGIWVLTTAGDMLYATSGSAANRLALVTGGIMYGGASAPAWLAKPSVDSFLQMGSPGTPSWFGKSKVPGLLHKYAYDFTDSTTSTPSTSFVNTNLSFNLTLTETCTIVAWAIMFGRKNSGSANGYFDISIDGTINPNGDVIFTSAISAQYSLLYHRTGITAGTRNVKVQYKTSSAGDETYLVRGSLFAAAFVE